MFTNLDTGGKWFQQDKSDLHPFGNHIGWKPKRVQLRPRQPETRILRKEIDFQGPALHAVDASRYPVPPHLEAVFHGRQRMAEWAAQLYMLKLEVMDWKPQPFSPDLDIAWVCQQIETIRLRVLQAAPWCVCGCGVDDCPHCENKQWLSAGKYLMECIVAQQLPLPEYLRGNPSLQPQPEANSELSEDQSWSI